MSERIAAFERLLGPIHSTFMCEALAGNDPPKDDAVMFTYGGAGGSFWTTYADYKAAMGDPWADHDRAMESYAQGMETREGEAPNGASVED